MSGFNQGADRNQGYLLPERIDEYVCEANPVRVIEAFVFASSGARSTATEFQIGEPSRLFAHHPYLRPAQNETRRLIEVLGELIIASLCKWTASLLIGVQVRKTDGLGH
jgi:hypothetical protein